MGELIIVQAQIGYLSANRLQASIDHVQIVGQLQLELDCFQIGIGGEKTSVTFRCINKNLAHFNTDQIFQVNEPLGIETFEVIGVDVQTLQI